LFGSRPRLRTLLSVFALIGSAALLSACGGEGDDESAAAAPVVSDGSSGAPATTLPASGTNRKPTISGVAPTSIVAGTQYSFTPTASDADGDVLTFSVTGLPSWATFNTSTGRVRGTPGQGDVGSSATITITVSDGKTTATLAAFTVKVVATASGSVTLTWTPPTQNVDGSPLTDLAGYRIYWGTAQGEYTNSASISNPGLTSYVVEQLTPATWYFATTALNGQGIESAFSNVAQKTIL